MACHYKCHCHCHCIFAEVCRLRLAELDVSCNRISTLYPDLIHMTSLVTFRMHDNPLVSPPARVGFFRLSWYFSKKSSENDANLVVCWKFWSIYSANYVRFSNLNKIIPIPTPPSPLGQNTVRSAQMLTLRFFGCLKVEKRP